jgi:hypothetical protein
MDNLHKTIKSIYEAIEYIEKNCDPFKILEYERDLLEYNEPKIALEGLCDEIDDRELKLPHNILENLKEIAMYYELEPRYFDSLKSE